MSVRVWPSYHQVTMKELQNYIRNLLTSELQNLDFLLKAKLMEFKEMEIKIVKSNEQISTFSKEISKLKESLKSVVDENKVLMETADKKESKINQLMKTNFQLQMENYDQENARKVENQEKDLIIKALTEEIGSVRKEKESVEEELSYTLEELEVMKKLKESNDELEITKKTYDSLGSSSFGSKKDDANDSIDDLLKSDSEDEDRDRSCSMSKVKVSGKSLKGKRSAEEELYSSKMKKGRDVDILELMDIELNKLKTSTRQ